MMDVSSAEQQAAADSAGALPLSRNVDMTAAVKGGSPGGFRSCSFFPPRSSRVRASKNDGGSR
jgi:hypothetical protein